MTYKAGAPIRQHPTRPRNIGLANNRQALGPADQAHAALSILMFAAAGVDTKSIPQLTK